MNGSCFNRSHRIIGSKLACITRMLWAAEAEVDISLPVGLSCPIVQEISCAGLEGV